MDETLASLSALTPVALLPRPNEAHHAGLGMGGSPHDSPAKQLAAMLRSTLRSPSADGAQATVGIPETLAGGECLVQGMPACFKLISGRCSTSHIDTCKWVWRAALKTAW